MKKSAAPTETEKYYSCVDERNTLIEKSYNEERHSSNEWEKLSGSGCYMKKKIIYGDDLFDEESFD